MVFFDESFSIPHTTLSDWYAHTHNGYSRSKRKQQKRIAFPFPSIWNHYANILLFARVCCAENDDFAIFFSFGFHFGQNGGEHTPHINAGEGQTSAASNKPLSQQQNDSFSIKRRPPRRWCIQPNRRQTFRRRINHCSGSASFFSFFCYA